MSDAASILYPNGAQGVAAPAPPTPSPAPAPIPADEVQTSAQAPAAAPPAPPADPAPVVEAPPIDYPDSFHDVRWMGEPPASSVTDYATFTLPERTREANLAASGLNPSQQAADRAQHQQALEGMQRVGLGVTAGRAFYDMARDAAMNPQQFDRATSEAQLRSEWGGRYDANLAAVGQMISQVERSWPNVRQYLDSTGLGNNPAFLIAAARKATGS